MLIAYIDPGILSVAVQTAFVVVFGSLAAYTMAPWRYLRSLFSRGQAAESSGEIATPSDSVDEKS